MTNVSVVWAAVTEAELAAIASAQWRTWPAKVPLRRAHDRAGAAAAAERFARELGAGSVVMLQVDEAFAWQPRLAVDVAALNMALTAAIMVDAEYLGAVSDVQIREAEKALGLEFPAHWRNFIRSGAWFRRGWMRTGAYVWLYEPSETVDHLRAWGESTDAHPGIVIIGGDGGGEMLTLDARDSNPPVMLTPNVSAGWQDSIEQTRTVQAFVTAIADGTFEFAFDK